MIGSVLLELLAAEARAAGITHPTATMQSANNIGQALIQKIAPRVDIRHQRGEATLVAALAAT